MDDMLSWDLKVIEVLAHDCHWTFQYAVLVYLYGVQTYYCVGLLSQYNTDLHARSMILSYVVGPLIARPVIPSSRYAYRAVGDLLLDYQTCYRPPGTLPQVYATLLPRSRYVVQRHARYCYCLSLQRRPRGLVSAP